MKKILSVFLILAMSVTCAFSVYADSVAPVYTFSDEEWEGYWEQSVADSDALALTPGSDESELNFAWHSPLTDKNAVVRISRNPDMSDYREFAARFAFADIVGQKVNKATVTGLEENTLYYYVYGTNGVFSEVYTYRTHSAESFKLLYVSDIQVKNDEDDAARLGNMAHEWQKTLDAATSANDDISFIVSAGDQTHNGDDYLEWRGTLSPTYMTSFSMATVVGNHDNKGMTYRSYTNNPNIFVSGHFSKTGDNYWFRYGDVLFLMLNAMTANFGNQLNFVQSAVAKNTDAKWRVAVMHHDVYGTGGHAEDTESKAMSVFYGAIFDQYEIDVVLTGHEHTYGRSFFMNDSGVVPNDDYSTGSVTNPEGTIYFTNGAASGNSDVPSEPYKFWWLAETKIIAGSVYSTIEFTDSTFTLKAFDAATNGQIDEFSITKTADADYDKLETYTFINLLQDCFVNALGSESLFLAIIDEAMSRYIPFLKWLF